MRHVLIIAAREIRDKKLLFLGAALCALIVVLSPLLPGSGNDAPVEVMTTTGLVLALMFLFGSVIFLGVGIINRDLQEGRMGFYLARPVPTPSIWIAKTLATVVIAVALASIVVAVPTMLGRGLLVLKTYAEDARQFGLVSAVFFEQPIRNTLLLSILLLAQAQFWGLGLRTRSPWLLLDLLGVSIATVLFWTAVRPFILNQAEWDVMVITLAFVVIASLLMMGGNLLGFRRGRTDLQTTHRWTSIFTAVLLIAGASTIAIYSSAERDIDLRTLQEVSLIDASERGDWLAIAGAERRTGAYWSAFIVNTETGQIIETPNSRPMISENGAVAVIWQRETLEHEVIAHRIELSRPYATTPLELTVPMETSWGGKRWWWPESDISREGDRLAWVHENTVGIHDLHEDASLFTAQVPEPEMLRSIQFINDSHLLVLSRSGGEGPWTIRKIDPDARSWEVLGTLPPGWCWPMENWIVWISERDSELRTYELRIANDLSLASSHTVKNGRYLSDGRFLEILEGEATALRLYKLDGSLATTVELPRGEKIEGSRQLSPMFIAIKVRSPVLSYLVNLDTSEVMTLDRDIDLFRRGGWWGPIETSPYANRVVNHDGQLALFDIRTFELTPLPGTVSDKRFDEIRMK